MDFDTHCEQAPENPVDQQEFECPGCTYKAIYDQELGEWFS